MIILFPLDFVLMVLAVCVFLGVGWATLIASWLWSHAIIVGIIFLVIHILYSVFSVIAVGSDYSIAGMICAVIHAIFPPIIIIKSYQMTVATNDNFGTYLLFEWMLVFFCMSGIEYLWSKATETRGGLSYFRLIVFTGLSVVASVMLVMLIQSEGF